MSGECHENIKNEDRAYIPGAACKDHQEVPDPAESLIITLPELLSGVKLTLFRRQLFTCGRKRMGKPLGEVEACSQGEADEQPE